MKRDKIFVGLQFLLFLLYFAPVSATVQAPGVFRYLGIIVAIIGLVLLITSIFQLDKNLTAYPTPKVNGSLIKHGLYRFVRHPIYTGVISVFLGYGLFRSSWFKLGIALVLILLFYFKSQYEESKLEEKYPDYEAYKQKTGRFFPKF